MLQGTLQATDLLKLLDKMYKYEMDPSRTVDTTERTRDVGQMDGRTDRQTDGVKPTTWLCWGYKYSNFQARQLSWKWHLQNGGHIALVAMCQDLWCYTMPQYVDWYSPY